MKKLTIAVIATFGLALASCAEQKDEGVGFVVGAITYELSPDRQRLTVIDGDIVKVYCREKTVGTTIYFGPCPPA